MQKITSPAAAAVPEIPEVDALVSIEDDGRTITARDERGEYLASAARTPSGGWVIAADNGERVLFATVLDDSHDSHDTARAWVELVAGTPRCC